LVPFAVPGWLHRQRRLCRSSPATARTCSPHSSWPADLFRRRGARRHRPRAPPRRHLADLPAWSGLTTEQLSYRERAEGWLVDPSLEPVV